MLKAQSRGSAVSASEIIRWTPAERLIVAQESLRLRLEDESLTPQVAVRHAQAKLPKGRRRPSFRDWKKTASWLLPLWDDLSAQMKEGKPLVTVKRSKLADSTQAPPEPPQAPTPAEPPPAEATLPAATNEAPMPAIEAEAAAAPDAPPVPDSAAGPEPAPAVQAGQEAEPKRGLVRWTADERERIARRSREIRKKIDLDPLEAVRAANIELDEDRQRDISTISLVSDWLLPMWADMDREELQAKEAKERAERERAEQEAQEAARLAEEARQREAEIEEAVEARLSGTTFEGLLRQLAQKIAATLMENVSESLEAAITARVSAAMAAIPNAVLSQHIEGAETVAIAPKDHKPRVCVVGLLNQQAEDVKRAFGAALDFTFIKSQHTGGSGAHGGAGMLARANGHDLVVSMTNFTGHDVDEAAKKLHIPFVRLNGSVSALKRWLQQWLNGEIALAS